MRIVHFNAGGPQFKGLEYQFAAHQYHIVDELRRAGHDVITIDPVAILGRVDSAEAYGEATLEAVRAFHADGGCDLFFSGATDATLSAGAVRAIGALGIPTVNLNFDDLSHPYRVRNITPAYDLVWTTVRETMDIIRGYGAKRLVQMPFAANPHVFAPAQAQEERAVTFIGTCYGARFRSVCTLAQSDIPTWVRGQSPFTYYNEGAAPVPVLRALRSSADGWQRAVRSLSFPSGRACVRAALVRSVEGLWRNVPEKTPNVGPIEFGPGPSFEDMPAAYARTALSLGSIELASTFVLRNPLFFIRVREFEVPMCGGVHFVNYYPELTEYFEPDREMLFYGSPDEMIDKARFWLDPARDSARQAIRLAARARAEAEHSWSARFRAIFRELGLREGR